jgi:pimeloyl-ACP methyl ester carboxylesterase
LDIDPEQGKRDAGRTTDTPTLVLWGQNDPVSPLSWTRGLDSVFTNLDMKIYPECGRFIAVEKAHAAAEDVLGASPSA